MTLDNYSLSQVKLGHKSKLFSSCSPPISQSVPTNVTETVGTTAHRMYITQVKTTNSTFEEDVYCVVPRINGSKIQISWHKSRIDLGLTNRDEVRELGRTAHEMYNTQVKAINSTIALASILIKGSLHAFSYDQSLDIFYFMGTSIFICQKWFTGQVGQLVNEMRHF